MLLGIAIGSSGTTVPSPEVLLGWVTILPELVGVSLRMIRVDLETGTKGAADCPSVLVASLRAGIFPGAASLGSGVNPTPPELCSVLLL